VSDAPETRVNRAGAFSTIDEMKHFVDRYLVAATWQVQNAGKESKDGGEQGI